MFNMNRQILCRILSIPRNTVMDLNNVMTCGRARIMIDYRLDCAKEGDCL